MFQNFYFRSATYMEFLIYFNPRMWSLLMWGQFAVKLRVTIKQQLHCIYIKLQLHSSTLCGDTVILQRQATFVGYIPHVYNVGDPKPPFTPYNSWGLLSVQAAPVHLHSVWPFITRFLFLWKSSVLVRANMNFAVWLEKWSWNFFSTANGLCYLDGYMPGEIITV